ncbi:MAG: hypothetical protein ACD_45C00671G0001 [uncultured bacterium]|nr:MAG: hypothetical protein ACD_45C00671G0001 [uncultured bacterium]OGT46160.1 MAG: hypothetical protein A3E83_04370 [Gammaproteobacteria bacterium RIFCSPHIGHO2_12_FULL_41_20]
MELIDYYHEQCIQGRIHEDAQQLIALRQLQKTLEQLVMENKKRAQMFSFLHKPQLITGVYLWGSVGIGKTLLMDCFYHCLPFPQKMRMHFHAFMQLIQQELKKHQGEKNPLQIIAKNIAKKTQVLCFDEFFVTDIVDAMLLERLLTTLFAQHVCLITTSNVMPDDLYKEGLQRQSFLPAIDLLKHYTQVIHIPTTIDYRLRHLKQAGVFYTPNDALAHELMEKSFSALANNSHVKQEPIQLYDRVIPVKKRTENIIWFDFNVICHIPRSQQDYLAIAKKFHTIFISDIPQLPADDKDKISLFIRLVDILYDQHVRLVCSATVSIEQIYPQGYMAAEYARTRSRLLEMQSEEYFLKGNLDWVLMI